VLNNTIKVSLAAVLGAPLERTGACKHLRGMTIRVDPRMNVSL
jgi:hypothetical protein